MDDNIKKLHNSIENKDYYKVKELIEKGVDLSPIYDEAYGMDAIFPSTLTTICTSSIKAEDKIALARYLLKYRAYAGIVNVYTLSPIIATAKNYDISFMKLLLDHGFDTSDTDKETNLTAFSILNDMNNDSLNKILSLVDEIHDPFLKINKQNYFIYKKKDYEPYILGSLKDENEDSFLHQGIPFALYILWCAKNNLLIEKVSELLFSFLDDENITATKDMLALVRSVIGDELTVDYIKTVENINPDTEKSEIYFTDEYLSLTKWKYNFYDDLKVFFSFDNGFNIPKNKTSCQLIFDLLDFRYEQYKKNWVFSLNANPVTSSLKNTINIDYNVVEGGLLPENFLIK